MKLYAAVIFSLIAHFMLFLAVKKIAPRIETLRQPVVEVVIIDDPNSRVVMQPESPPSDTTENTPTPLLSEENQRFKQQQRAALIDKTVNRSTAPKIEILKEQLLERLKAVNELSEQVIKQIEAEKKTIPQAEINPNLFKPNSLPSTVNDPLTNIPIGSFTALNTNRYLYYSYFARIEEQIRNRWVAHIRNVIDRSPFIPIDKRSRDIWTTEVEILLDKDGYFVRADVHHTSGLDRLDYAAMDAFREGAPILNPPQGLVSEDGYIHLRYAFNVFWKPQTYREQIRQ